MIIFCLELEESDAIVLGMSMYHIEMCGASAGLCKAIKSILEES